MIHPGPAAFPGCIHAPGFNVSQYMTTRTARGLVHICLALAFVVLGLFFWAAGLGESWSCRPGELAFVFRTPSGSLRVRTERDAEPIDLMLLDSDPCYLGHISIGGARYQSGLATGRMLRLAEEWTGRQTPHERREAINIRISQLIAECGAVPFGFDEAFARRELPIRGVLSDRSSLFGYLTRAASILFAIAAARSVYVAVRSLCWRP